MNPLLLFLPVAILFLAFLLFWALRTKRSAVSSSSLAETWEALAVLELEIPPRALAERIFSTRDWDLISSQTSVGMQREFLQERRVVALSWLRQTRKRATRLMDFHRRAVRRNINLDPAVEIKLAANYVVFVFVYEMLVGLIWLGGPFHARTMADYAIGVAERLWSISGQLLANLDAAQLGRIKASWSDKSAAS